jgi:UDP-N-acetylglucosamine--N-acetylmuramyl-(pentapeptide) pyrophosphoryl-undecaprenol N-acetylglucosamine transferase
VTSSVVIAAGGTAGHVNPALALAESLREHDVSFIGTKAGFERELVTKAGLAFEAIEVRGFDRSRPSTIAAVGWTATRAVGAARSILKRMSPSVVVGMGGYVSLPVSLAARSLRIPVVLHEQNIVLGLANRVSKRWARVIAVSFEETLSETGSRGVLVGDPVSSDIATADRAAERARGIERWELDPGRATLIVFGGSLGALRLNEAAAGLAAEWSGRADRQVLHIVGRRGAGAELEVPSEGDLIFRRVDFVDRMVEAYAVADLALCRGGATTLAELEVMKLPSVIVPYPHHRDRQQERQARVLERAGAAVVLADSETTSDRVAAEADALLDDRARLDSMRDAAGALARPDAAAKLASIVLESSR